MRFNVSSETRLRRSIPRMVPFRLAVVLTQACCILLVAFAAAAATPPPSHLNFPENTTDCVVLLSFNLSITRDPFSVLSSWSRSLHFCRWRGVTCGGGQLSQRVVGLDLPGLDFTGNLSPSLSNLTFLRWLRLPNNQLGGRIPPDLGRLHRLKHLDLGSNYLVGKLPANLSRCADLRFLSVDFNMIYGEVPGELGSLSQLEKFSLQHNMLTGRIPPSIGNLTSLQELHLGNNTLDGSIPAEVGSLTRLRNLTLRYNTLSGRIPTNLFNLSSLRLLDVSGNRLIGDLPLDMGHHLRQLEELLMNDNRFDGEIPSSLGDASNLRHLHLGGNQLEASDWIFLDSLKNCTQLTNLALDRNRIDGSLPVGISNLTAQLRSLDISCNRISGSIHPDFGRLVNLVSLDMAGNLLSGPIPAAVGTLRELKQLSLHSNGLSMAMPSSLGNLSRLVELRLNTNHLEGGIPIQSFQNCKFLRVFDLSGNRLSGQISRLVAGLCSELQRLSLSHNSLAGSLPSEIGRLKGLKSLDISHNSFSGEVPWSLGDCESLELLHIDRNSFEGSLPLTLSKLTALKRMNASHNHFSGNIPESIGGLQFLNVLDLSFNDLEGEVPQGGILPNLTVYSVAGNPRLCGGDPKLRLPKCPLRNPDKQKRRQVVLIATSIVACSVLLLLLLCALARRYQHVFRSGEKSSSSAQAATSGDVNLQHPMISYRELLKATNHFSRENLIGEGCFGSVYKGVLDAGRTHVAVKVLHLHRHGASKSFEAECEALRRVRHRNIARVITSCSSLDNRGDSFKALVLEFMPNGSLEKWLHPKEFNHAATSLSFDRMLGIAMDVACALDYLHRLCGTSVVHCDLKPGNVLLDGDMCARVSDFGMSRILTSASGRRRSRNRSLTNSIGIKGSFGYVAPEYGFGIKPHAPGDVYSYGILLLEMLTGRRPTDELFKEGLNLRIYVETSFPSQIMAIIDPRLSQEEHYGSRGNLQDLGIIKQKLQRCVISLVMVGLLCTKESPGERMEMSDVIREIYKIRSVLSG